MRNETVEITLSNRDESYRLIVQLIIFNSHFINLQPPIAISAQRKIAK